MRYTVTVKDKDGHVGTKTCSVIVSPNTPFRTQTPGGWGSKPNGNNPGAFLASFFTQGTLVDLLGGEIKCILFGALVAGICIYKGISARGGAEGVARAVHSGVVWCFVGIQALEYLYTPTVLALFHNQNVLR